MSSPAESHTRHGFGKEPTIVGTPEDDRIEGTKKAAGELYRGNGGDDELVDGSGTDACSNGEETRGCES